LGSIDASSDHPHGLELTSVALVTESPLANSVT
jgi:hypothetical protein